MGTMQDLYFSRLPYLQRIQLVNEFNLYIPPLIRMKILEDSRFPGPLQFVVLDKISVSFVVKLFVEQG